MKLHMMREIATLFFMPIYVLTVLHAPYFLGWHNALPCVWIGDSQSQNSIFAKELIGGAPCKYACVQISSVGMTSTMKVEPQKGSVAT